MLKIAILLCLSAAKVKKTDFKYIFFKFPIDREKEEKRKDSKIAFSRITASVWARTSWKRACKHENTESAAYS